MSHINRIPLNGGYVSTGADARSADDLDAGELVSMEGAFYRKNDRGQVWKMPGRSEFGSAGSGAVKGIAICQFDEGGTDKLVASIGTTLVAATPGVTGTFASLVTGLDADSEFFTACHQDDRFYLGNGYDANRVLQPDGTVRLMSLLAPTGQPTLSTASTASAITRPTVEDFPSSSWTNTGRAYDADTTTFASATSGIAEWHGWAADSSPSRILRISWSGSVGTAGGRFAILKSENGGVSFPATILNVSYTSPQEITQRWLEIAVSADSEDIHIRASPTDYDPDSTFRIHDIRIEVGSSANVSTTDGVYYAYTEILNGEGPDGYLESAPSAYSALLTFSSKSQVIVTRPAAINTSATHWQVYRIGDGVAKTLDNLGLVSGFISIDDLTWTDNLTDVAITVQATPIISLLTIGDLSFARDLPAPIALNMISWKGSIVIISRTNRRSLAYSESGRPESFPAPYIIDSFPLDEHDGLIGQMAVGETLVMLCEGAVLAIDDLPRVTDGVFDAGSARPLKGHPGCVGEYAYTAWSVAGEPRGAWVSPFGVYVTNGQICACISTDLAWESEVSVPDLGTSVLRWDQKNLILWFEFDHNGSGHNTREMPFHMAEAHSKGESRPKLGQPTAKATSCMASALIGAAHYRFTGHPSDGSVYVEERGTVDESTGEEVEMVVKPGQLGIAKINSAVIKATVNHSDFGPGENGTLTFTLYRDSSNSQNSREQDVRLDGHRGTTVGVARAGESIDFEIRYSGPGTGGIGTVDLEIEGQGRAGSAPRVVSSSVTP